MANYGQKNQAYGLVGLNGTGTITNPSILGTGINANQISNGSVSNTAFGYLANVSSDIQTQINNLDSGYTNFVATAMPTVNINLANPGTAIFDGVTLASGQSLFIGNNQTDATAIGVYVFNGSSSPLTRLPTMNSWENIVGSRVTIAEGGSVNDNTVWNNNNNAGGTLGITDIIYIQSYNNYISGTGVTITGNSIAIGQSVAISATPSFASETLSSDTNFMTTGTTNAMTWTQAAQTATHTFTLPNANSNPVQSVSASTGQALSAVDSTGTFSKIVVINQALTGFTAGSGTVAATDTILQGIQKLAGTAPTGFNVTHKTTSYQITTLDKIVILDADALTGTLPSATTVIPGFEYILKLGTGANTGTLAVTTGQYIDGVLNGNFSIVGQYNSVSAISDGSAWFTV